MKQIKLSLAIVLGKLAGFLSRHLGFGFGSSLPGLLALKIEPKILNKLSKKIKIGSTLISGTNGKTTTARFISSIVKATNLTKLHNSAGANLLTGLTTTLIQKTNLFGDLIADLGLFEVDEATLPKAILEVQPKIVLTTNLFRDQLDRYGELDHLAQIWRQAFMKMSPKTTILLNADDPQVASLGKNLKQKVLYYGIEDKTYHIEEKQHAADSIYCPSCLLPYQYQIIFFSHMGKYLCPKCKTKRPAPQIFADKIFQDEASTKLHLVTLSGSFWIKINLPGFYNIYNALAAVAWANAFGLDTESIKKGFEMFSFAFGRLEKIKIKDKNILMILVKNPAGFNEVLRNFGQKSSYLILALNDNIADGQDVSWIWDVDFEMLAQSKNKIIASGKRAEDMILRLKYAGIEKSRLSIEKNYKKVLTGSLDKIKSGETVHIYPTYTAMLEIRRLLQKLGYASSLETYD